LIFDIGLENFKVSFLGVELLPPFNAWLFQGCKQNLISGKLCIENHGIFKIKNQQNWKSFNQINTNFH
jgi:hypothetical protein